MSDITEHQNEILTRLVRRMRDVAIPVGPQHAWWDLIFDIEAFLSGQETVLKMTADEFIVEAEKYLMSDSDDKIQHPGEIFAAAVVSELTKEVDQFAYAIGIRSFKLAAYIYAAIVISIPPLAIEIITYLLK